MSGEMSIEMFLYKNDPYRSTTAKRPFPLPLPLYLERPSIKVTDLVKDGAKLRAKIISQLQDHDINAYDITFWLQSKPGYPGTGDQKQLALHVGDRFADHSMQQGFSAAKRNIHAILLENNVQDAEVEIQNPHRCFEPILLPVHSKDPHVELYNRVRENIWECVHGELGNKLHSMCIFRVRPYFKAPSTTFDVVITVSPLTVHKWLDLQSTVQRILTEGMRGPEQHTTVLFIPGYARSLPAKTGVSFADSLEYLPGLGASIGVAGEHGGTLGGYMTLETGGQIHRGFLTSSHVVAPPVSASQTLRDRYDTEGVSIDNAPLDPIRTKVQWMANKDVVATRDETREELASLARQQAAYQERVSRRSILGKSIGPDTLELTTIRQRINRLEDSRIICQSIPRTIGMVLCSTGKAVSAGGWIMDTAFVEVDDTNPHMWEHCMNSNKLPEAILVRGKPKHWGLKDSYLVPTHISREGDLEYNKWCLKVGRTTGITSGICHGTQAFVRMTNADDSEQKRCQYDANGTRGGSEPVLRTTEYVICSGEIPLMRDSGVNSVRVVMRDLALSIVMGGWLGSSLVLLLGFVDALPKLLW